jgi:hypothetical protein
VPAPMWLEHRVYDPPEPLRAVSRLFSTRETAELNAKGLGIVVERAVSLNGQDAVATALAQQFLPSPDAFRFGGSTVEELLRARRDIVAAFLRSKFGLEMVRPSRRSGA